MKNKDRNIFIIGAGFSAPAKLPIQNKILKEISQPPSIDFLSFEPTSESIKFMISFIRVGLYLLQNYTSFKCDEEIDAFSTIERDQQFNHSSTLDKDNRYREIQVLREKIRSKLEEADLQVSLEDIFTSFDKSYQGREYLNHHSFYQVDEIRDAITRLFVYYFSKRINTHLFDSLEYKNFCNYIKSIHNVTILSTNWDVLIEEYFSHEKIKYDLCLNEPYYTPLTSKANSPRAVKLIKLHGSINWFKCLNCGTLNIVDNNRCGKFLFDDSTDEHCAECGCKTKDGILLQSEIITPTMIKTINNQLYNNLWSAAKKDLMSAATVTFIGYSLPTADYELRYLSQRSIPQGVTINVVLHDSDNPSITEHHSLKDLLPERRYRDLFAKNKVEFYYNGFGEYFANLVRQN